MNEKNLLDNLVKEGEDVLKTSYNPYTVGPTLVNVEYFRKWQSKCILFLKELLGSENIIFNNFVNNVDSNEYFKVKEGIGILKSLIDIDNAFYLLKDNNSSLKNIEDILNNFHKVARQLKIRRENRDTLIINDEYDVQDLLHALLRIHFNDVRVEEWTPSHAGSSSRMDFLIKDLNVVIETKMTRDSLKDKKLGEELIIDIEKYFKHENCDILYCFIYDPSELINNPKALENDLSRDNGELQVKVIIVPKF